VQWLSGNQNVAVALAAAFGLIVGSFLNVVILRVPARLLFFWRQQSRELLDIPVTAEPSPPGIVWEPSHCPKCMHRLGALENIPVLSWILLRGRCKHCGIAISVQYPVVEVLTAAASAIVVWKFGVSWQSAAGLLLTWNLIVLAVIDLRTQLLPDQLTLSLLWLGLVLSAVPLFVGSTASILGAIFGYMSLWCVYWLFKLTTGKEGMGYGDFKLLCALGAWMGPAALLPIVLVSSLVGAVIGGAFLLIARRERSTTIPFGPFIAGAGWLWFIGPDWLNNTYSALFSFR
jgi:leader peptidase (prepilin peptidase) / N-methyltransferase